MAILSASTSLTRYRIIDDIPESLWADIPDLIHSYCFEDIDASSDESSSGWVPFEDPFDTEWKESSFYRGEYLTFSLRLDTRRVPLAVLKKYYKMGLDDLLARNKDKGRHFVSKEEKKELREQTRLRLLQRSLPVPAYFDVVWNSQTQKVYLSSTTKKIRELFEEKFTQTFDLHLEPCTPFFHALGLLGQSSKEELVSYEPCLFV
ncbi:MAG TPA: recombination-associated protein RdgC [Desulfohalobiaceae bacterium]|nr:recombination-associated protein RdgC [Desulfohalobiaceae bacterium]